MCRHVTRTIMEVLYVMHGLSVVHARWRAAAHHDAPSGVSCKHSAGFNALLGCVPDENIQCMDAWMDKGRPLTKENAMSKARTHDRQQKLLLMSTMVVPDGSCLVMDIGWAEKHQG